MKSILVIGTGKFGHHLVKKLLELKNEVMIVDCNEDNIRDLFSHVTSARVGDCTKPEVLKTLGLRNFDIVIVCIGENFQNSLEVTSLVKEYGAQHVISMASRDIQAKFLLRNGADEVIYPDRDVAYNLAAKCSANHVFDYIKLTDEYAIYEIPALPEWFGKSIREVDVRAKYNINIIGTKSVSDNKIQIMPSADYIFNENDHIQVLCQKEDIDKILKHIK